MGRIKKRIYPAVCQNPECGKDFMGDKLGRMYCSKSCRSKHMYVLMPEMREKSRTSMKKIRVLPEVQEKLNKHLHSESNPFRHPEVRRKAHAALREQGYAHLNGGNGKAISIPQKLLAARLGWQTECVVLTMKKRGEGYPPAYKIDIADPVLKIGIEVDGHSHSLEKVKIKDRKKDDFLTSLGWKIFRFKNKEVLEDLEGVVKTIMSSILKPRQGTTSQRES